MNAHARRPRGRRRGADAEPQRTPTTKRGGRRGRCPGALDLWQIVRWLDERLPDDAILTNGAGNYSTWLHRLYRYRRFRTQLAPYVGRDGLRRAGRDRGEAAASASGMVRLVERRRLLPDERPGARDRRPVRARDRLRRRRQRHVRDDPDAPGAHLSGAGATAPRSSIPISPRSRARTARTARRSRAPTSSRRRSNARSRADAPGAPAPQARSAGADDERVARRAARAGAPDQRWNASSESPAARRARSSRCLRCRPSVPAAATDSSAA